MSMVSCRCGACSLEVAGAVRLRFICHCTICQRFNASPQADMAVFRRDEVALATDCPIEYERYKKRMGVDRGRCRECGQPVVEFMQLPLVPGIAFAPAAAVAAVMPLPEPAMRLFYDKRVADADDDLPRFSGFLASQLAASRRLLPALMRRAA